MSMATRDHRSKQHVKGTAVGMNGATLVAHAMRQVHPDVVAAYPITPQTIITETFSEFVANGEVHTEFVPVESEHAALSACIGAAAAGARAQTATSGPGLALMWEVLYVASGNRLPIVLHLCSRALSAPINIHGDHSDAMGARDSGWVMLFAETGQEAYDNGIMAVRIAEHPQVMLPVMSVMDGFTTTHAVERGEMLPDEVVANFAGIYNAPYSLLRPEQPVTIGTLDFHDFYFEHKRQQVEAMEQALAVTKEVAREFGDVSGRYYGPLEPYRMEDAEVAVVIVGSAAGTIKAVVDRLRQQGVRAGSLKVRLFRPFPAEDVAKALESVRAVAVLDRSAAFGAAGHPLYLEVLAALHGFGIFPRLRSYVYGLGGRDVRLAEFQRVYEELLRPPEEAPGPQAVGFLGLRE